MAACEMFMWMMSYSFKLHTPPHYKKTFKKTFSIDPENENDGICLQKRQRFIIHKNIFIPEDTFEKSKYRIKIQITSSGMGCICDYTNKISPVYTVHSRVVYTFWLYGVHFREVSREKTFIPSHT